MSRKPQALLQNIKESGLSAKTKKASTSHSLPSIKVLPGDKQKFDIACTRSNLNQWDMFHLILTEAKLDDHD